MKGKTDFDKLRRTTEREIKEQVKNDPDSVIPTEDELKEFKKVKEKENCDEQTWKTNNLY